MATSHLHLTRFVRQLLDRMAPQVRVGLDRAIDIGTWLDLYSRDLQWN